MISISNADRDKAVKFMRSYASLLQERRERTAKTMNERRMALNLAKKLDRKKPAPTDSSPNRKRQTK